MNLRASAFSAVRWTTTSVVLRALLQLAQTMVLARLLTPSDFGLLAMSGAVYAIVVLFADLGLTSALIHFPDPSPQARSTLYWLNQGAAAAMMLLFMALAWPVSVLYQEPELLPVMLAMSLAIPLSALGQQFLVLGEKDLRFSMVALVEFGGSACGAMTALLAAVCGGGVYSLVAGALASAAANSALAWMFLSAGIRPGLGFDLREAQRYLHYGAYRLGETVAMSLRSQADVLIGGALTGSAAMGLYTIPRNLALQLATMLVNPVVTRVGLPVMAKVQGDQAALKSIYLKTLRATSAVNFPIYVALSVWAEEAVSLLLGPQWRGAGGYLRLFAVWALLLSVGNPVGSLLYATGHVRRAFWWNVAQLLVVPVLLWLGAWLDGARGLAASLLAAQCVLFYPMFRFLVRPACGAGFREYVAQLLPALIASLAAVGIGASVSSALPVHDLLTVVAGITVAAFIYLAVSRAINKPWFELLAELLHPRESR